MFLDDIKDFPRLDRPHHWILGLVLVLVAIIVLVVVLIKIFIFP